MKISESTGSIPLDHTDRNHVNRYPYRSLFRASPRWGLGRMGGKNRGVATSRITNIQNAHRDRRDLSHADFRRTRTQTYRNGRRRKNGKTNCRPDGYSFPYSLTFRVVTLCQHVIHDETIGIEQIGREQNHGRGN